MPTDAPKPASVGLLLAGGGSTRFGAPKGQALLDGVTLNQLAYRRLQITCDVVALSGASREDVEAEAQLADPPGLPSGPLSGILSGLLWAADRGAEWLIVTPCDTPLIRPEDLSDLESLARTSDSKLAILTGPDGPHPLCSVWHTCLAAPLKAELANSHPPVWKFAADQHAAQLAITEPERLVNVNTQDDLRAITTAEHLFWWRD